jgi:tetratricopeptide (TPR) repeat protein
MRNTYEQLPGSLFIVAVFIASIIPAAAAAPFLFQSRNSIEGRITTIENKGLANVPVFLLNDAYGQRAQTYTDGSGRYRFRNLGIGNYYVQVESGGTGYERETQRVEVNPYIPSGSGAETFRVDFVLKLKTPARKTSSSEDVAPGADNVVFLQDIPRAAKEAYQQGEQSLKKNDLKMAEINLARAIELFPDYYDALELLGSEYIKHEYFDAAAPLLAHAVEVNKNAWHSFYGLGVSLIELKRRNEGLDALRRSVNLNPKSINASMRLGLELAKEDQYVDEAIKLLTTVTHMAGKRLPDAYLALASLHSRKKQYGAAADALDEYLRAVPTGEHRDEIKQKIQDLRQKETKAKKNEQTG